MNWRSKKSLESCERDLNAIKGLTDAVRANLENAHAKREFAFDDLNAIDDRVERLNRESREVIMNCAEEIATTVISDITESVVRPCLCNIKKYIIAAHRRADNTAGQRGYYQGRAYASCQALAPLMGLSILETYSKMRDAVEEAMLGIIEETDWDATDYAEICEKWKLTPDEAHDLHQFLVHEVAENSAHAEAEIWGD